MALLSWRDFGKETLKSTFERKSRKLRAWERNICAMIRTANDRSRLTGRKTCPSPTLPSTTPTELNLDPTRASSVRCRSPTRTNVCQFLSPLHKCPQQRITSERPCETALTTSRLTLPCPPWEANRGSASESICPILWNPKAYWHIHNSQHLHHILHQTNPAQPLRLHFIPCLHL